MKTRIEGRARPLGAPGSGGDAIAASQPDRGHIPEGMHGAPSGHALPREKAPLNGAPSGRALPRRKAPPHGVPSWVQGGAVFFVTICCAVRNENQLCEQEIAATLFEAVEFRQTRGDWHVHLLVLMPDHLHLLVSFPSDEAMKRVISNFKEMTAKKTGVTWQQNFFDHRLRSGESFDEKAHYVRMNPVRKGLVTCAEDWPYIWTTTDTARPAVAPYLGNGTARPAVAPYLGNGTARPAVAPYLP